MTAPAKPEPPTVSAGPDLTVTLPVNSVKMDGKATGNDGATISGAFWEQWSGPSFLKFSNEWDLSTTLTRTMVAGTYTLKLLVSDSRNETSVASVTLTVKPAKGGASVTPGAIPGRTTEITAEDTTDNSLSGMPAAGFRIYPNPVQGLLNLRLAGSASGKVQVNIYNESGVRVQTIALEKGQWSLKRSSIDVSRLAKGIYVIQLVNSANGSVTGISQSSSR